MKGATLVNLARFEEALEVLDKAIEVNQKDIAAVSNKGAALLNLGRFEEALEVLNRQSRLVPIMDMQYRGEVLL